MKDHWSELVIVLGGADGSGLRILAARELRDLRDQTTISALRERAMTETRRGEAFSRSQDYEPKTLRAGVLRGAVELVAGHLCARPESLRVHLYRLLPDGTSFDKRDAALSDLDPICNLSEQGLRVSVTLHGPYEGRVFFLVAARPRRGAYLNASADRPTVVSQVLDLPETTLGLTKLQAPQQPRQRARHALASFVAAVETNPAYRLLAILAVLITLGSCVFAVLALAGLL